MVRIERDRPRGAGAKSCWSAALGALQTGGERDQASGQSYVEVVLGDLDGDFAEIRKKGHAALRAWVKARREKAEYGVMAAAYKAGRLYLGRDGEKLYYVLEDG